MKKSIEETSLTSVYLYGRSLFSWPSWLRSGLALYPVAEIGGFITVRRKQIIRTRLQSEIGSDYIGLVRVTGLEPARLRHQNLNLARLPFRHTRGDTRLVYALRRVLSIRMRGAAEKNGRMVLDG